MVLQNHAHAKPWMLLFDKLDFFLRCLVLAHSRLPIFFCNCSLQLTKFSNPHLLVYEIAYCGGVL